MAKSKYLDYIMGFIFITFIFLLIVHLTFGMKEFFKIYGFIGIIIPSVFLYVFGLLGYYIFRRKKVT